MYIHVDKYYAVYYLQPFVKFAVILLAFKTNTIVKYIFISAVSVTIKKPKLRRFKKPKATDTEIF